MKRLFCFMGVLTMCVSPIFAQDAKTSEKVEFKRHWFLQVQAGASETLGEGKFSKLVSPAAALNAGHQFSPVWALRFGLSGWQSKGAWASPASVYKYNFVQGNVDAVMDLANLFGRFNARRTVNPYLFAGVGVNGAFDNDQAVALNDAGHTLGNLWRDSKAFVAGRFGVGVNFRLSDCVLIGIEANANMLSDKYNSKKAGNLDWQFNALAGLTFRLGKNYKKSVAPAAVAMTPVTTVPQTEEAPVAEKPETSVSPKTMTSQTAPVSVKVAELREDIFYTIGSTAIRTSEQSKLASLTDYLKANPSAKVVLTGYADAQTGSAAINERLSKQRAEGVAAALGKAGIAADRIVVEYKGDTEAPFATPEQNRVTVCIAQ